MDNPTELKCALYATLLRLKEPTDAEINVMYHLCRDRSVQEQLEKAMNRERSNVSKR